MIKLALALLILAYPAHANAQGQALHCVSPALSAQLPPSTHLVQPAAGQFLARLQINLNTPVLDIYVVEGYRKAAIFYSDGRMLCGGIVVDLEKTQQGLLSVVHRFGA